MFTQNEIASEKQKSPEEIYSACCNAVVLIYNYDSDNTLLGYGSGVIVTATGVVYTNYHVVDKGYRIKIRNGNDIYNNIPIVGFNPFNDAAILKLPEGSYPFMRLQMMKILNPEAVFMRWEIRSGTLKLLHREL